jgi:hypothetical protein
MAMLMQAQQTTAGQQMPSDAFEASTAQPAAPAPGGAQLADATLSGLIDAQQSQSSSATDGASRPHGHHGHHRQGGASASGATAQPASSTATDGAAAAQTTSISV